MARPVRPPHNEDSSSDESYSQDSFEADAEEEEKKKADNVKDGAMPEAGTGGSNKPSKGGGGVLMSSRFHGGSSSGSSKKNQSNRLLAATATISGVGGGCAKAANASDDTSADSLKSSACQPSACSTTTGIGSVSSPAMASLNSQDSQNAVSSDKKSGGGRLKGTFGMGIRGRSNSNDLRKQQAQAMTQAKNGAGRPEDAAAAGMGSAAASDQAGTPMPTHLCTKKEPWKVLNYDAVKVCERIGGGGMALVFRGLYNETKIALKTLFDPNVTAELRQTFVDELIVMSRMDHPNVVKFIGASTTPPRLFFAMELCKSSLFDLLHRQPELAMSTADRIQICLEIASGMQYIHSLTPPVIHRDLKSHNILLATDGKVRICDFGLVGIRCASAGTPNYMAPELLTGATYTKAVDVYAFALVAWEVFACKVPFFGCDVADIRLRACRGSRPPMPTSVPEALQGIIRQCWFTNPSKRPSFCRIVSLLTPLLCKGEREKPCDGSRQLDMGDDALDKMLREMH